jgi:hypothetical protein
MLEGGDIAPVGNTRWQGAGNDVGQGPRGRALFAVMARPPAAHAATARQTGPLDDVSLRFAPCGSIR